MLKALVILGTFILFGCAGPEPVQVTGFEDVPFGTTRPSLADRIDPDQPGCSVQLRDRPSGNLVFAEDRLVLIWFESPAASRSGITTGAPVEAVLKTYPHAERLTAPPGSHRFDGLLVVDGAQGYLFLHDGTTVRKAIAGYVDYLRRLFDTGFGVC